MLITADARHLPLQDECVDCIVTSPPYWGLRNYADNPNQIGLEATPEAYIENMLAVFAEAWRVLKPSGTAWLNLGDCYTSIGRSGRKESQGDPNAHFKWTLPGGQKPKDLVGIPWRVALALQAAGWWLRSDIIWAKPNPMPESVTDRPTRSHEYLFLLTKAERYYYDAKAIAEPYAESTMREAAAEYNGVGLKDYESAGVQNPSDTKRRIIEGIRMKRSLRIGGGKGSLNGDRCDGDRHDDEFIVQAAGRNKRSVWTIPTAPYSGAHFATFPERLVEPCILAGCPIGGLVFDPFIGSGTVGAVAERTGRRWVGTDLSYQHLSTERTAQMGLRW